MNVIRFLNTHGPEGLKKLREEPYYIKVREYPEHNLFTLNYDQLNSPRGDAIVLECRALILDYQFQVVSRAFDRFFDFDEMPQVTKGFDLARSVLHEKADGSLISLYFHKEKGEWNFATRSTAFSEQPHPRYDSFEAAILGTLKRGLSRAAFQATCSRMKLDKEYTYIFEARGPDFLVVRPYEENALELLGVRHKSGTQNDDARLNSFGFVKDPAEVAQVAKAFAEQGLKVDANRTESFEADKGLEGLFEKAKNLPTYHEGFVVHDPESGVRMKIKNPNYVAIHQMREGGIISFKNVLKLLLSTNRNAASDYLALNPQDQGYFDRFKGEIDGFLENLENTYKATQHIQDQKEFALAVKGVPASFMLFEAKKRGVPFAQVFNETPTDKLLNCFKHLYKSEDASADQEQKKRPKP